MCGLAGIFGYASDAPKVDQEELLRVNEQMRVRGPDGEGIWLTSDRQVGLAHRRLAIIDLSNAGAQPMSDPLTGNQIVFNGEVYNFRSLRAELEASGEVFASFSDTEVILKLYRKFGAAMLNKLRGMFAIAIFDAKKNGIFLARDPIGIKPLYYADDGKTIRFASQVKALLRGQVDRSPDPAGHVGFLLWGAVPEPYTMYKSIRLLPAGHSMWIDRFAARDPQRFDSVSGRLIRAMDNPLKLTNLEALGRIEDIIRGSVAAHLVADVPVGVFLSAGIDSTIIAKLASASISNLHTLTIGFTEYLQTEHDETTIAEQVARSIGSIHHTIYVSKNDFLMERLRILNDMDQPSIDGVNTWFVSKLAADAGLKVALSGLGGDEILGSYSSFTQIPTLLKYLSFAKNLASFPAFFRKITAPIFSLTNNYNKVPGIFEYANSIERAYVLRRALFMPWEIAEILGKEFSQEGFDILRPTDRISTMIGGLKSTRLAISCMEIEQYMCNQLLRDADWAGMANSLEIRVPFADIELISELGSVFAGNSKISKRMVAESIIPEHRSVISRPKTGFTVPASVQGQPWLSGSNYYRNLACAFINRQSFLHLN